MTTAETTVENYTPSADAIERGNKQDLVYMTVLNAMADTMMEQDMTPAEVIGAAYLAIAYFAESVNRRSAGSMIHG